MSFKKLADLEAKVKVLIAHSSELKQRNVELEHRLREAAARLAEQELSIRRWEKERLWLRNRLRKAVDQLGRLDGTDHD